MPVENQNEITEQEPTPEQRIAELSTQAQALFDTYTIPPEIKEDGSMVRIMRPIKTQSSSYTFAQLQERTPAEEGAPKEYEYSYALYDRLTDTQVMQWDEGSSELTQGVRFTLYPEDPLQVIKVNEIDAKVLHALQTRLHSLEAAFKNDLIANARVSEREAPQPKSQLNRLQSALGKIILFRNNPK